MSVNGFVPLIWSDQVLDVLEKIQVAANLCNRDYEGEIRGLGDSVRINEIGDIAINAYVKNSTTNLTIQELTDAHQTLQITRARYFGFKLDSVDDAQTKPKLMEKATQRAAYGMKDDMDTWILQTLSSGGFFAGTNSTQLGSTVTELSVTSTLVLNAMSWAARIHDANNVPTNGRWMVVSPDIKFDMVLAKIISDTNNSDAIRTGQISPGLVGTFYGYDIYVSNNVPRLGAASSQHLCIFGHNMGVTFAQQLADMEAFRLTDQGFGDAVKGLNLYGMKVTRPAAILRGVFSV
jgi:hypothetical protein